MNNQYLISIIVPIYNVEDYLRKCIESILGQTYQNFQLILIDDGSKDNSGNLCDEYALLDKRVEAIHQPNGGPVNARKAGLALAKGDYIGFVDADDYIEPDFYANMMKHMVREDVDFVHSGYIAENGRSGEVCNQYTEGLYDISDSQAAFISNYILKVDSNTHMPHNLWTKLFKADLVKACFMQVPDCQWRGEDLICLCLCVLKSHKIFLDAAAKYHYVARETSITKKASIENVSDYGALYKYLMDIFGYYGKLELVKDELDNYFKDFYITFFAFTLKIKNIIIYKFGAANILKRKKIVLYCAGKVGQDYYMQLSKYREIDIVAWADKEYKKYSFDYREIIGKEDIVHYDFDILLIAALNKSLAEEIQCELIEIGISGDKIVWEPPVRILAE